MVGSRRGGWDRLLPILVDHFRVITYDLRGHGASPMPVGRFGLDALVDDVEALRQTLDIEVMHIAGHSLGGMIGPCLCQTAPKPSAVLGSAVDGSFSHLRG